MSITQIRAMRRRLEDLRGALIGYKAGAEPAWLRLMSLTLLEVQAHESDERVLGVIRSKVQGDPRAARRTVERLRDARPTYESDRAARLIAAALTGSRVEPVPARQRELFEQEATLGRASVADAFRSLVAREPELQRIRDQLARDYAKVTATDDAGEDVSKRYAGRQVLLDAEREVAGIVGPSSNHPAPILRSYLARNIAFRALELVSENPGNYAADEPYFHTEPGL